MPTQQTMTAAAAAQVTTAVWQLLPRGMTGLMQHRTAGTLLLLTPSAAATVASVRISASACARGRLLLLPPPLLLLLRRQQQQCRMLPGWQLP
jgi:hypothetical protein